MCVLLYARCCVYITADERIRSCQCHVLAFPLEWRNTPLLSLVRSTFTFTFYLCRTFVDVRCRCAFQWTRLLFRLRKNRCDRESRLSFAEILFLFPPSSFDTFGHSMNAYYVIAETAMGQEETPLVKFASEPFIREDDRQ